MATKDFVGWFNDDDHYELDYVETMVNHALAHDADVSFCAWNQIFKCDFALCSSTSGNYIVRRELAQRVGYPNTFHDGKYSYETDGHFINALAGAGRIAPRVDRVLYAHNYQP